MVDARKEDDDDEPTLAPCLACGGEYKRLLEEAGRHRMVICGFCERGAQSPAQRRDWMLKRRLPGSSK